MPPSDSDPDDGWTTRTGWRSDRPDPPNQPTAERWDPTHPVLVRPVRAVRDAPGGRRLGGIPSRRRRHFWPPEHHPIGPVGHGQCRPSRTGPTGTVGPPSGSTLHGRTPVGRARLASPGEGRPRPGSGWGPTASRSRRWNGHGSRNHRWKGHGPKHHGPRNHGPKNHGPRSHGSSPPAGGARQHDCGQKPAPRPLQRRGAATAAGARSGRLQRRTRPPVDRTGQPRAAGAGTDAAAPYHPTWPGPRSAHRPGRDAPTPRLRSRVRGAGDDDSGGDLLSQGATPQVPSALGGLNFRVRDGNGCDSAAMATGNLAQRTAAPPMTRPAPVSLP